MKKNPNFGKVRSAETKTKIIITREIAIYVFSKNGSLINTFTSANKAEEFFNIHSKTILRYCSNS